MENIKKNIHKTARLRKVNRIKERDHCIYERCEFASPEQEMQINS